MGRAEPRSSYRPTEVPNYKLIAIELGDQLKYVTTFNEIERVASAIFPFDRKGHSHPSITSARAQLLYDWVMTLAEQDTSDASKMELLRQFVHAIAPADSPARNFVREGGDMAASARPAGWHLIHPHIQKIADARFSSGHYADAVEAALKEVNSRVKAVVKSTTGEELDGAPLMNTAFSPKTPIIILDDLSTESGRNIQLGYMQIFAGAMTGIRNPKAHANIKITPERALRFLILAGLLMEKLDEAKCP